MAFYGAGSITFVSGVESSKNTTVAITYFSLCTMIGMGIVTSIGPVIFAGYGFFSLIVLGLASISIPTSLALGASVLGVVAETMGFPALFAGATFISLLSGCYVHKALWDDGKMSKCAA